MNGRKYGMQAPDMSRANWRKSSYSGSNGNCIEAASVGSRIVIRDSKAPEDRRLAFPSTTWRAFATDLKRRA